MRTLLALALAFLSACDTGEVAPVPSPLVGTWDLTALTSETLVTSRVDQSIPDLSAQGEGGIEVAGAVTDRLRYVWYVDRQQGTLDEVVFGTTPGPPAAGIPVVTLGVGAGLGPSVLNWLPQGVDTPEVRYEAGGQAPYSYENGRFVVPAVTLRADDGSQVQAQGSLTVPLVRLAADREVSVERRDGSTDGRAIAFTEAGTFTQSAEGDVFLTGTWQTDGAESLELRPGGRPVDYAIEPRVTYRVDGSVLRLTRSFDRGCTDECLPSYAANHYAEPGSITRVRTVVVETYRRVR
ncbi:hypothetical protein [Rubrivirga sp. IMCC45206]|uniref:hypothetical protein n=1 Tax=Rubrivirga sp. IMCC45206 TaxID=3391614 RepID=UPI0039900319